MQVEMNQGQQKQECVELNGQQILNFCEGLGEFGRMIKEQSNKQWFIMHPILQIRQKSIITTSDAANKKYLKTLKGDRSDTKELNINIKTLTVSHLRQLSTANELSPQETQIITNYSKMPACFQSISYLFFGGDDAGNDKKIGDLSEEEFNSNQIKQNARPYGEARKNLRRQCRNLYRSTFFIRNFFRSSRMHFKNKLIILKYLKKIQYLPFRRFKQKTYQWKNIDFQS